MEADALDKDWQYAPAICVQYIIPCLQMYTVSLGHLTGPIKKFASRKLANTSLPRGGQNQ